MDNAPLLAHILPSKTRHISPKRLPKIYCLHPNHPYKHALPLKINIRATLYFLPLWTIKIVFLYLIYKESPPPLKSRPVKKVPSAPATNKKGSKSSQGQEPSYLFINRGQPKYDLRSLLRVPCLNLLIAFSLIWRTRSLVRPNLSPISSNVIS